MVALGLALLQKEPGISMKRQTGAILLIVWG
jgi:hypothetical protein